jgi:hypothetical protein
MNTLTVTCLACQADITFTEPAEGTWEPILSGEAGFGPEPTVVGEQVTVRCLNCAHRTVVNREDVTP